MLQIKNLTKVFGSGEEKYLAVDKLSLNIEQGQLVVLIGPSGCGKTTTLKMINRLEKPTSGEILINGTDTSQMDVVELRRGIGYVIQDIGLFPHLTIAENVEIVPKLKKMDKPKRRARTKELLEMVGLDPDIYAERYPAELSGGQQQRIGVLRALAAEPELILMDEPFGALDPITREQLQDEMKDLQKRVAKTIVFVTHDIDEALKLADKIVLMKDGKIIQADSPEDMIKNPQNDYVREFIGEERLALQPDNTPVSDVMLTDMLIVPVESSPENVLMKMQRKKADFAVVVDDAKRHIGIISANRIQLQRGRGTSLEKMLEKQQKCVRGNTTVNDAATTLAQDTRVLCVVDRKKRPLGLVSRATLLQGLVEIWNDQ